MQSSLRLGGQIKLSAKQFRDIERQDLGDSLSNPYLIPMIFNSAYVLVCKAGDVPCKAKCWDLFLIVRSKKKVQKAEDASIVDIKESPCPM